MARVVGNIASTGLNQTRKENPSIKAATPDLIVFDNSSLSVDSMADLIFEDIGGQELLEISRSDLINSANVAFPKIKSKRRFNDYINSVAGATFSLPLQSIQLANHTPQFVDPIILNDVGSIEIRVVNVLPEYQVEVQIVSKANRFNDTIYSEEQGESS
jgi:hypothetical protein